MAVKATPYEKFVGEVVTITKGRYAGKTGYCDDDDGDGRLIIYLGSFMDGYFVVRSGYVRIATKREAAAYSAEFMSSPERFYRLTAQRLVGS